MQLNSIKQSIRSNLSLNVVLKYAYVYRDNEILLIVMQISYRMFQFEIANNSTKSFFVVIENKLNNA